MTELSRRSLTAFLLDYAEAAEDLAEEAKRREKAAKTAAMKHKHGRR